MSEPEIARRCQACGASIRDRAFFCPQCGISLQSAEHAETQPLRSEEVAPTIRPALESNPETPANDTMPLNPTPTTIHQRSGGSAPNYGKRPAPRQPVEQRNGGVIQRVEKLRKISTVVIDQAAYDPSLRFILVAGFLFLIFVIILILSKFIG